MLESLEERKWDGVIVGFGVRGGSNLEVTIHFESKPSAHVISGNSCITLRSGSTDIINGLRVHAPHTRIMFNYNPTSTLEAVQRAFPLLEGSGHPATNYVRTYADSAYLYTFEMLKVTFAGRAYTL